MRRITDSGTSIAVTSLHNGSRVDNTGKNEFPPRRVIMADTIKGKIENAGEAVKNTAKKAGEKVKEGAETVAEKTADATKSVGQAAKDAGQKLKDKSGA